MAVEIIEFLDAVDLAEAAGGPVSVLLGNGFSMGYNHKIFGYASLAEEAKISGLSVPKDDLFERLSTSNFELVIEKLRSAADLGEFYGARRSFIDQLRADADAVRDGLADVLADRHPEHAYELSDEEVRFARAFLSNFDSIYTLNYDLLLYWVVNRASVSFSVPQADGFEWPTYHDRSRLIWKSNPSTPQNVYYLHGALHMYVEDSRVRKLSYNADGRLVEEMRTRLEAGRYPLIVTEGTCEEKVARIDRSAYLRTAHRRFARLSGSLFIHGVAMSDNDGHILEALEAQTCEVAHLFVGIHGRQNTRANRALVGRAEEIVDNRKELKGHKLDLHFYDSATAQVWR